jgi:hypothetical protein
VEKVAGTVWIAELQNSWHCQAVRDADENILAWIVYANKVKKMVVYAASTFVGVCLIMLCIWVRRGAAVRHGRGVGGGEGRDRLLAIPNNR